MADTTTPIIIKRIKKGGHAHHGGAWKVAYADFVTAMMAFFLLLWLLSVTSPEQKLGLAEYFTPTVGIKDAMGIGFKGGRKPVSDPGRSATDLTAPGLVVGQVKQGPVAQSPSEVQPKDSNEEAESTSTDRKTKEEDKQENQEGKDKNESADSEDFKAAGDEIKQSLEKDPDLQEIKNNIVVQDTPEGMKIDIIDDPKKQMFAAGSATLTSNGKKLLDSMANLIVKMPNNITITGHTDASPMPSPQYTSWELSSDRANAARRALQTTQLEPGRVTKIIGLADRELIMPQDPTNPRNRRITILLIRGSYFRDPKSAGPTTRGLLSLPDAQVKKPEPVKEAPPPPVPQAPSGIFDPTKQPEQ